jgi:hypothetical protein
MQGKPVDRNITLPADIHKWLADLAKRNLRSSQAEIVIALREKMEREVTA